MSGICGYFNLHGEDVAREDWEPMIQALSHLGPDGRGVWMGQGLRLGQQMRLVVAEGMAESQPCHDAEAGLTICSDARLDNRDDLLLQLRIPQHEQDGLSDARLILLAWKAWGERCPERLLGSFAFSIWDERQRRLFCCRDQMGRSPLFYFFDGRRFLFASEAKAILSVSGIPRRLNAAKLATAWRPEARWALHEQSFYEGIFSAPAGTLLTIDAAGLRKRVYWTPESSSPWPYKSDGEAIEAFQALMNEVLRAQTRSLYPVGALLSGGLDSSGVVSVAARCLSQRGQRLTTISSVLPEASNFSQSPHLTDEREFIDEFRSWPAIEMRFIADQARGPFDDLSRITTQAESPLISSRHYLYTAFAQTARESGIRVLLNGDWGELGPSAYAHIYYVELLRRFQWMALTRELQRRSRLQGASPSRLVLQLLVRPWLRKIVSNGTGISTTPKMPLALQESFVAPHLKRIPIAASRREIGAKRSGSPGLDHREHQRQNLWISYRKHANPPGSFAGYEHVEMRYPFCDIRLLEFCLAAPGDMKVRNGYTRYLVRAGLDGILPPRIQWRTCKGPFSPDYEMRYRAQRPIAKAMVNEIGPNDPVRAIVDIERLAKLLEQATPTEEMQIVPLTIYLLCFLRQFSDFRP